MYLYHDYKKKLICLVFLVKKMANPTDTAYMTPYNGLYIAHAQENNKENK